MKQQNEALISERKRLEQRATDLAESLAVSRDCFLVLLYSYVVIVVVPLIEVMKTSVVLCEGYGNTDTHYTS